MAQYLPIDKPRNRNNKQRQKLEDKKVGEKKYSKPVQFFWENPLSV